VISVYGKGGTKTFKRASQNASQAKSGYNFVVKCSPFKHFLRLEAGSAAVEDPFIWQPAGGAGWRSSRLETRKALALLAYLALEDRSHSRESLATLLWPEFEAERAFHNLRRSLWAINKALGKEWIAGERDSLRLPRTPSLWIDVQAFSDHLSGLESHGHPNSETCPACLPHLEAAAALYRAPFLEGFACPTARGSKTGSFSNAKS
jgi:hypothetical protein